MRPPTETMVQALRDLNRRIDIVDRRPTPRVANPEGSGVAVVSSISEVPGDIQPGIAFFVLGDNVAVDANGATTHDPDGVRWTLRRFLAYRSGIPLTAL